MSEVNPNVPPGTQPLAGPPGSEAPPPVPPAPAEQPEPASSPATPSGVVPGGDALTGDGAPRQEPAAENAPGASEGTDQDEGADTSTDEEPSMPDEDRLAEMLEQSKASATSHDVVDSGLPEPTPVGTEHVVQDNVSDPDNHDATLASGLTEQSNSEGAQETSYADGGSSVHEDHAPSAGDPAGAPLDPSLSRGTLDPS